MRKSWTLAVVFFVALATMSCSDDDDASFPGSYEFQDKKTNLALGVIWLDDEASTADNGDKIYTHDVTLASEGLGADGLSGKGSILSFSLMTKGATVTPGTYVFKSGLADMGVDYAYLQADYIAGEFDSGTQYTFYDSEVKVEGGNGTYTITFSGTVYDNEKGSDSERFDISGTYSGKLDDSPTN
jgi:hypothetical protein